MAKNAPAKKTAPPPARKQPDPAPAPRRPVSRDPREGDEPEADPEREERGGEEQTLAQRAATGVASPPTPTNESAATANDEPGAGGDTAPVPRRRVIGAEEADIVKVKVAKPFTLHDDKGGAHHYGAGEQRMPADHADHWYAKVHGVEKL